MAEVYPAGDPRNAQYNETLAGITLAEETSLSGIKETLGTLESNTNYAEGRQTAAEPGAFRGIDNRASSQGLLESGIETRRTGDQISSFAAQRAQRQQRLSEGRQGAQRHEEQERKKAENERGQAAKKAESENYTDILNHPQAATASVPGVPTIASSKPQPITGSSKPKVGGKYVKGPNGERIYQAF